ncbi:hypothetical protein BS47DRAFT_412803 [Hydnum rufescens UP504]|uniref:Uncharacterized protein n=1 Tax=Hydnum rufescens UP504 TaxID=1448309 RepID=A0A9P6DZU2_9AGAM|nr:hypothetical protein BS47DRAFT_412803 [Hydnum rufescens UP504]
MRGVASVVIDGAGVAWKAGSSSPLWRGRGVGCGVGSAGVPVSAGVIGSAGVAVPEWAGVAGPGSAGVVVFESTGSVELGVVGAGSEGVVGGGSMGESAGLRHGQAVLCQRECHQVCRRKVDHGRHRWEITYRIGGCDWSSSRFRFESQISIINVEIVIIVGVLFIVKLRRGFLGNGLRSRRCGIN